MVKKIYIHPFFLLCTGIILMTGFIKPYLLLFYLFCIHELGHILTALYYHWNIKKIIILPFGGLTIFEEAFNRPMKEELIITIMGPIFQILAYFLLEPTINQPYFLTLHLAFLLFNLFPIYPLDGSKLVLLILERYLSFYYSYQTILWISFLLSILLFFTFPPNFIFFCMLFFLLKRGWDEYYKLTFTFYKFLLERYLKHIHFSKYLKVKKLNLKKMRRERSHIFLVQNNWVSETTILKKWFDK